MLRVFVIDDNIDAATSLAAVVELLGHTAAYATGGDLLEEVRSFKPHVVILDLVLPKISGFDIAKMIRQEPGLCEVELVVLSGRHDDQHRERAKILGVSRYFLKPVEIDVLENMLERLENGLMASAGE